MKLNYPHIAAANKILTKNSSLIDYFPQET